MDATGVSTGLRPPLPAVRLLLGAFCLLTAAGLATLFFLAPQTDRTFAWTITPPVTAAFLGSGYGAGLVLSALSLRARTWAEVRVPYVTVLVFTWLTTAATFLHLDRMHFTTPGRGPLAEPAAWFWTGVYVVVPVAMAVLLVPQAHAPGRDPQRRLPLPPALRVAVALEGAVLLAVGAVLFVAPGAADRVWPWALTPLTARVVAAWLVAFGVASALVERADDLDRLGTAAVAYAVFGVLQLVTLMRFAGQVSWDARGWAWAAVAAAVAATGVAGAARVARARRGPAVP